MSVKMAEICPLSSRSLHQAPVVLMASSGAEVPGQLQSPGLADLRGVPVEEELGGLVLLWLGKVGQSAL